MFGRQDIEDEFSRAVAVAGCQSCIHAARQTLQMIIHQYHRGLLNSLWYNLHCMPIRPRIWEYFLHIGNFH